VDANERDMRVQELCAQGLSQNAIARTLKISRRTVQRIIQRLEQGLRKPAEAGAAEAAAPQLRMEGLPHSAQGLYDIVVRFGQVEAQRLRRAEVRTHQVEEALCPALQDFQEVRAEQSKMVREVRESVGELLQATGQLLRELPEETA
jgi:transposase